MGSYKNRLLLSRMKPLCVDTPSVLRDTLLAKCQRNNVHLTIIHAPAGYGKTIFLIQCFQQLREQLQHACWLRLDETMDDPILLSIYLINIISRTGLIQKEFIDVADKGFEGLEQEEVLNLVINCISELKQPITIFLDDYHLISKEFTQKIICKLVESTPDYIRFIVASRKLPSALKGRLQISRSYSEVSSHDLALSVTEISEFFSLANNVNISDELTRALYSKTKGWAAAIKFAKAWFNEGNEVNLNTLDDCTKGFTTLISTQIFE